MLPVRDLGRVELDTDFVRTFVCRVVCLSLDAMRAAAAAGAGSPKFLT
jgi:hypothetical protein